MLKSIPFILVLFVSLAQAQERGVQLEWDKIEGAKLYELEIQSANSEVIKTVKFDSHEFAFDLVSGKYWIRARTYDHRKVVGPWSTLEELTVPPADIELSKKPEPELRADVQSLKAKVDLAWLSSSGAHLYELKITDSKGNLYKRELSTTQWTQELPTGDYKFELTAMARDGLRSETQSFSVQVLGAQMGEIQILPFDPKQPAQLQWRGGPTGAEYSGILERQDLAAEDEDWDELVRFEAQKASQLKVNETLRPGKYRLKVQAHAKGWSPSNTVNYEFIVKPTLRELSSIPEEAKTAFDFMKISQ